MGYVAWKPWSLFPLTTLHWLSLSRSAISPLHGLLIPVSREVKPYNRALAPSTSWQPAIFLFRYLRITNSKRFFFTSIHISLHFYILTLFTHYTTLFTLLPLTYKTRRFWDNEGCNPPDTQAQNHVSTHGPYIRHTSDSRKRSNIASMLH
jgi:hypothetical protein